MLKKITILLLQLALTINVNAGTDGELLLKNNHQKLKIVQKDLIELLCT